MKANKLTAILVFLLLAAGLPAMAEEEEAPELLVQFNYYLYNNQVPFVQLRSGVKINKQYRPVPGIPFRVYLDSVSEGSLIGKVKSNPQGNATLAIPKTLKEAWYASPKHLLICQTDAVKPYAETEQELEITQAKLQIDTLNDGESRSIVATLMERTGPDEWTPVAETDLKIGIRRLGGILSAGTDETYATDEEGTAMALYEREALPGDKKGNLTLVAKLEENEFYGNLVTEMPAPWGIKTAGINEAFEERTLWSTRDKAPYWLLFLANSIIVAVWGVIIYLVIQVFRIRKLGNETA